MRLLLVVLCLAFVPPGLQGCFLRHKKAPAPVPVPAAAPASQPAAPPPPVEQWEAVAPEARLYYDDVDAFPDSVRLEVRDPDTWQDIWRRATMRQASTPPTPMVDFGRQMVLVVAAGRMKTGDEIHVDSIGTLDGRVRVVVRTLAQCGDIPTDAHPFEIVRVPGSDQSVVFLERRVEGGDCP